MGITVGVLYALFAHGRIYADGNTCVLHER